MIKFKMSEKFNIESRFQKYLKLVNLKESTMHPVQLSQTRRAFFGAFGMALVMFRDDITDLTEEDAINQFEDLAEQVQRFLNFDKIA